MPKATKTAKKTKVTKQDLEAQPELVKVGVKEGDAVEYKEPANRKNVKMVIFTIRGENHREFSKDVHGDKFLDLADQFGETNKHKITARADV